MFSGERILTAKKPTLWNRFLHLVHLRPPEDVETPTSPREALELGYRLGIETGYSEGLVDGVDLGMDVGVDIVAGISDPNDSLN